MRESMDNAANEQLGDWESLVVGNARPGLRDPLRDLLLVDRLLARIVLTANEPALAQIRLAWWREELTREREGLGAPPDPLLASLLESWPSERKVLASLADGWETLLPEDEDSAFEAGGLAAARGEAFAALAVMSGCAHAASDAARHGQAWAHAELVLIGGSKESALLSEGLRVAEELPRLPAGLRPLAMIGGLSRRSLKRGGKPLFGDRLSPFAALRLGIFGT